MSLVQLLVPERYFVKDPNSSELGKKIVSKGVDLVHQLGFEDFTFKKLATCIDSTEASIYRYFENKLKFLLFLTTLYWRWIDYLIDYKTHYLEDPEEKLRAILKILTHQEELLPISTNADIDLIHLRGLVMTESDKTYLTKQVDEINKEGLFKDYKALCKKIAEVIAVINPNYPYPRALVSTVLEASHQQAFFAMHLPSLTEIKLGEQSLDEQVMNFLQCTIDSAIKRN